MEKTIGKAVSTKLKAIGSHPSTQCNGAAETDCLREWRKPPKHRQQLANKRELLRKQQCSFRFTGLGRHHRHVG
jgi:hypothetical protein